MPSAPTLAAAVLALLSVVFDVRTRRIPNVLTLGAAGAALLFSLSTGGLPGLGWSAAGWAVGAALLMPLFLLRGLGAGDVKLLAAFGAWLGPAAVLWVAAYGFMAGGLLAVLVSFWRGYLGRTFRNVLGLLAYWRTAGPRPMPGLMLSDSTSVRIPYAIPLAAGMLVALWLQ